MARRFMMGKQFRALSRSTGHKEVVVQDAIIEYHNSELAAAEARGFARGRSADRTGLTRVHAR